jgi:hypothetical protein
MPVSRFYLLIRIKKGPFSKPFITGLSATIRFLTCDIMLPYGNITIKTSQILKKSSAALS